MTMTDLALCASAAGVLLAAGACGGGAPGAAAPYPAEHAPLPEAAYHGGRILASAKIVTVTWAGDDPALVARLAEFDDTIASTPWWTSATAEYCAQPAGAPCIGLGSGAGHVSIAGAPPASLTDSARGGPSTIQTLIRSGIADGTLPAPTADTLYMLYPPAGVSVELDGEPACGNLGAYHEALSLQDAGGPPIPVAYAVVPRCGDEAATTLAASHEMVEAATDPDVGLGVLGWAADGSAWTLFGGEVADLCELGGAGQPIFEAGFAVHRSWSNTSARASHDPCVPIPDGMAYFNTAARQEAIALGAAGDTARVDLDAFSDAATTAWSLSALDLQDLGLAFSFDRKSVRNGDHATLTVTATKPIPTEGGAIALVSTQGQTRELWWIAVRPPGSALRGICGVRQNRICAL